MVIIWAGCKLRVSFSKSFLFAGLFVLTLVCAVPAKSSAEEFARFFPREMAGFRLLGSMRFKTPPTGAGIPDPRAIPARALAGAEAQYLSEDGGRFLVELVRVPRDSDAYSLLTSFAQSIRDTGQANGARISRDVGTASFVLPERIAFFKGTTFVKISDVEKSGRDSDKILALGRLFADRLEKGEDDIPVLVKHLPLWEEAQGRALYLAGFRSLSGVVPNQPSLDAVSSEGDADAVVTNYGTSQLVLVEFNTPQLAGDNDRSVTAKIQELRGQGQPVPSAYRRVGNYSVFVFGAPGEQAANELIDQVKYEQLVQWLGNNPNLLEKAQRDYYQTTAGVLVSVVKASGLSLIACLTIGGLMGALLFSRRRAQQRSAEAFSDAGGMLRLNLDEMTPQNNPAKLLGPGN